MDITISDYHNIISTGGYHKTYLFPKKWWRLKAIHH